jgi:CHASE2 domain-containing sensor protein
MLNGIYAAGPSVIGIDILTNDEGRADAYRSLAGEFSTATGRALWISGAADPKFKVAWFPQWLIGAEDELVVKPTAVLGFEPEELDRRRIRWGVPVFPRDPDLGLRRFPREIYFEAAPPNEEEEALSWARIVALRYCAGRSDCRLPGGAVHEVYLPYAGGPQRRINALDIFRCPEMGSVETGGRLWSEFQEIAKGRIVLLGGTWGSARDSYDTPIGRIPGVLVNAYAVLAEINGTGIKERRLAVIFYDVAIGLGVAWIGWLTRHRRLRAMMTASGGLLAGALILNYWIFGRGYVLSFAGLIAGMFLHQMYEFWHMNPKAEEH